jgi:hypothetical protein
MQQKTKKYISNFCKILLLIIAVCLSAFALMSGAEDAGFWKNIPNGLPWIILLIFILIAFWRQVLGGILIILFGIFTIIFFSALQSLWILFLISLPLIVLGGILSLLTYKK